MFRKPSRRETECTHPDHQPMIPVCRTSDELDELSAMYACVMMTITQ